MRGSVPSNPSNKPVQRLAFLTGLALFMYLCMRTLRFTNDGLNLAFGFFFLVIPVLAIKPALRLPRVAKIAILTLLVPTLTFSLIGLSAMVACDIPDAVNHRQLSRELCALQQGQYSVHLVWKETSGGAIGPHGVSLEQRRSIVPGVYAVRFLDYFEGATEGTLSWAGYNRVELHIPIAGYSRDQRNIEREYSLKPWLYF